MTLYRLLWQIDIEADTPRDAAIMAREYQTKPGTTATVFTVLPADCETTKTLDIMLEGGFADEIDTSGLTCAACEENFGLVDLDTDQDINTTYRQWQCPRCGSWNDRDDIPER